MWRQALLVPSIEVMPCPNAISQRLLRHASREWGTKQVWVAMAMRNFEKFRGSKTKKNISKLHGTWSSGIAPCTH